MKMLEDRIRKDGIVREGNVLKVDSFINHQMDIPLFREMAKGVEAPVRRQAHQQGAHHRGQRHRHRGCGGQ